MVKKREELTEKVLDVDASIQGTIVFKDPVNLRVNGDFDGKLDAKGSLTIGETANVRADITGDHIAVAGNVQGDIHAGKSLAIVAPARIIGDIFTPSLSVTEGAIIEGRINMGNTDGVSDRDLSLSEVARYLEVEESVLEEWASKKKIPGKRTGDSWRFKKQEIDEWIQKEKVQV